MGLSNVISRLLQWWWSLFVSGGGGMGGTLYNTIHKLKCEQQAEGQLTYPSFFIKFDYRPAKHHVKQGQWAMFRLCEMVLSSQSLSLLGPSDSDPGAPLTCNATWARCFPQNLPQNVVWRTSTTLQALSWIAGQSTVSTRADMLP